MQDLTDVVRKQFPVELPPPQRGWWCVWRHGGASTHRWVLRRAGEDQADTEAFFDAIKGTMRQGGLLLQDPDGKIIRAYSAPRLRTRW